MKYIVCRVLHDEEPFLDIPILFPDMLVHAMVFTQMRALLEMQYFKASKKTTVIALSAGELSSMPFDCSMMCSGKSDSLGVKSREETDDQLIRMTDYGSCSLVD